MKHFSLRNLLLLCPMLGIGQSLDLSFGNAGKVITAPPVGGEYKLASTQVDVNNSTYVLGTVHYTRLNFSDIILKKYKPNGELDVNFNYTLNLNYTDVASDLVVLDNGKMVVFGYTVLTGGIRQLLMQEIDSNGTVGAGAYINTPQLPFDFEINAVRKTADGNFILVGTGSGANHNTDFFAIKTDPSGNLVSSFGNNGLLSLDVANTNDYAKDFAILDNGTLVITGYSTSSPKEKVAIVALDAQTGALKTSFGNGGKILQNMSTTGSDRGYKITALPNGTLLINGYSQLSNRQVLGLLNINPNTGQLNTTFDYDGRKVIYIGGKNDLSLDLALSNEGDIYLGGLSQQYNNVYKPVLVKILLNGNSDNTFGTSGVFIFDQVASAPIKLTLGNKNEPVLSALSNSSAFFISRLEANKALFTYNSTGATCDGLIHFSPIHTAGVHEWNFGNEEFPSTQNYSEAAPIHKYWLPGYYTVTHKYTDLNNHTFTASKTIFVHKAPNLRSRQWYVVPEGHETSVMAYTENFGYGNVAQRGAYSYELSYPGGTSTEGEKFVNFYTNAGFHSITFRVTSHTYPENACSTAVLHDSIMVVKNYFAVDTNNLVLGANLVTNGDFENPTPCPSNVFKSDFEQKCTMDGQYEPLKLAILNKQTDFAPVIEDNIPAVDFNSDGAYLYLSEKNSSLGTDPFSLGGSYTNVTNRNVWSQKVYVTAGKSYYFKVEANAIHFTYNYDYALPVVSLAIDQMPLVSNQVNDSKQVIASLYTAATSGWVTLRILKTTGVYFSDGSLGLDNIVFAEVLSNDEPLPEARQATGTDQSETSGLSVYPNPASDIITLTLGNGTSENLAGANLEIINSYGLTAIKDIAIQNNMVQLSVSQLSAGVYSAKVLTADGKVAGTTKFVVQP